MGPIDIENSVLGEKDVPKVRKSWFKKHWPILVILSVLLMMSSSCGINVGETTLALQEYLSQETTKDVVCPILPYVRPESFYKDNSTVLKIIGDKTFRDASAAKLTGAVKVKTDTYDDSPLVAENPEYWSEKFEPFHEYLKKTFPDVYEFTTVEKVNSWGLVYTWKGTDESLKPLLLTAHQDVVPTQDATLKDWTYPPYDGVYDGENLWGRGSADCKNMLIGLLESFQELKNSGFVPKRTVILGFGFDEEIGGERGANHIGQFLFTKYGRDSFYALIDEGGQSLIEEENVYLALPGTSEKGVVNVHIGLNTPGGHSSVPQDHTSIGLLSRVLTDIEDKLFDAFFTPRNPTFYEWQCIASHSPTLPKKVKLAFLNAEKHEKARDDSIQFLVNQSLTSRYLIQTSQAIDIIHGGAKSNALPEYVEAVINHRIAVESTVNSTVEKDLRHVFKVADKYNLGIIYEGVEIKPKTEKGYFTVWAEGYLEPAPNTPVNDDQWAVLGGVIRHVYEEIAYPSKFESKPIIVAPGMATGNTDTHWYWPLTDHIYRYRPGLTPTVQTHAHGVDEHIDFDSHLQIIAFFYQYIQVVDL